MNTVTITEQPVSVTVTDNGNTTVVQTTSTVAVSTVTAGPQGPPGPVGPPSLLLDDSAKVNKSVVYYDAAASSYKADATWTIDTLVDGANF